MADNSKKPWIDSEAPVLAGVVQITTSEDSVRKVFYIAQTLLDAKAPRFGKRFVTPGSDLPVVMNLRSFGTHTFASFVKWLETGTLDVEVESADHDPQRIPFLTSLPELRRFIGLHQFAEKYKIKALCEDVQRKLSASTRLTLNSGGGCERQDAGSIKNCFPPEMMAYIYDCTWPGDSLRNAFAVAFSAVNSVYQAPPEVLVKYRKDFLIDVIVQTAKASSDQQVPQETETQAADRQDNSHKQGEKRKRLN